MNAEAIASISVAVVALTQLIKMSAIPTENRSVVIGIVFGLSALGVGLWGFSHEPMWLRELAWSYFAGWVLVATSAAGVFGLAQKQPPISDPPVDASPVAVVRKRRTVS